nr:hypothetical protein [Pirellula staleyi]
MLQQIAGHVDYSGFIAHSAQPLLSFIVLSLKLWYSDQASRAFSNLTNVAHCLSIRLPTSDGWFTRVAASQDWRVASIAAAGITPNFHFAKLESPHRSIFILGHSNYPIVAFAKQVNAVDQRLQFVDESEISSEISRLFPDVAIAIAADLNRSITEDDLAQLAPIELRQVKYWKPCTIGQLAFNWWD